jgi:hypothetical protein
MLEPMFDTGCVWKRLKGRWVVEGPDELMIAGAWVDVWNEGDQRWDKRPILRPIPAGNGRSWALVDHRNKPGCSATL